MSAARRWREALEAWSIPESILSQAPESPWIHPPELFDVPETISSSPSHERARESLGEEGGVLDVGCGGGIATYALVPHVRKGVGVDHQAEMLSMYKTNGVRFGVEVETIEGFWPEVAPKAPVCDVAAAHHVVYNVPDIVPFLRALDEHARSRVVLELPATHPLSNMTAAWQHFWDLERPRGPTPSDLVDVLNEMGVAARLETWTGSTRGERDLDQAARFMRVRLCLPAERDSEVREFLAARAPVVQRALAVVWWDVAR
ncbi:MAG TPA: class I SAM-dependent methyltransferase [Acidimicrobiales bacterium]